MFHLAPAPPNAVGIAQLSLGLLDFCVTIIADSLGVLEVGHRGLFGGAFGAENLATVSAMMFAIGDGELSCAQNAIVGLRVIGPFPTTLFGQLYLYGLVFPA